MAFFKNPAWLLALVATASGCLDRPSVAPPQVLQSGVQLPIVNNAIDQVDILFEIDNSGSMRDNQALLATQFPVLIDQIVRPPRDPRTNRPLYPAVRDLHVGVISSDLGMPGGDSMRCANVDLGDDGQLNPIRFGDATRAHLPADVDPEIRNRLCGPGTHQYERFLTFDSATTSPDVFSRDFACNAFLSSGGCPIEQQLESVYRALVLHNPRSIPGSVSPNAGFMRENAILAIVIITDEEDGSTRDCRFAERNRAGVPLPCSDALSVFQEDNTDWGSTDPSDLNPRFYLYTPGSRQDPTWPLERYVDLADPTRGFLSLKPGHPERIIFSAIAGVPINLPRLPNRRIDWNSLLGTNPDGSDGLLAQSPEGMVSMRQNHPDPSCPTRVVPACRREGSRENTEPSMCNDTRAQYFALPSRRIAKVVRIFDERFNSGTLSSICQCSYDGALREIVNRIQSQLQGRCLPRRLNPESPVCCGADELPLGCSHAPSCTQPGAVSVRCRVRETLPATVRASEWCVPEHGRRPAGVANGREQCDVHQVAAVPGEAPLAGSHGFFYDTSYDPGAPECSQRVSFTANDSIPLGAEAFIDCVQSVVSDAATPDVTPTDATLPDAEPEDVPTDDGARPDHCVTE